MIYKLENSVELKVLKLLNLLKSRLKNISHINDSAGWNLSNFPRKKIKAGVNNCILNLEKTSLQVR